jgi:hypothetical protein
MDEHKFNEMLLDISKKENVVKCEPFKFRLSTSGKFSNDTGKYKEANYPIRNFVNAKGQTKPSQTTLSIELAKRLNSEQSQREIEKTVLPFIIEIYPSLLLSDIKKSSALIKFVFQSDMFWDVNYTLMSEEFICVSLSKNNNATTIYYLHDNEVKEIKQGQSKLHFEGFATASKKK